jgi:hypothetical protein
MIQHEIMKKAFIENTPEIPANFVIDFEELIHSLENYY